MKFKNKEKYPLELWSSYKTVLFQSMPVFNKWGLCCQSCPFWIPGLLREAVGQARGLRGDRGLALLWLILGENSLLPVSKLVFSGHSCGQEVPGSWWVSPQGIQGTFFKGTWQMVLREVNPGVCMRQKSRQSRLFRNVYVLGQLWLFTGKINQELKYFFFFQCISSVRGFSWP